ncbi:hypothetical protein POVWA2_024000 [Plasmodium ovale wallikeri]|uniref:Uncharacterized protein n=1 Tax=Plasmodium ovale wallikeri TaxID=864142 RepID=A0A1A8YTN8_PLAOA|nr:hypothetical protein POVWA1_024110 [Plasmodium ovale wallikeri]SBT35225.1 hypothetical protein POVWA2_024000 [Plasmodium ovale wallikeri]
MSDSAIHYKSRVKCAMRRRINLSRSENCMYGLSPVQTHCNILVLETGIRSSPQIETFKFANAQICKRGEDDPVEKRGIHITAWVQNFFRCTRKLGAKTCIFYDA